jgi:hypothetical protein
MNIVRLFPVVVLAACGGLLLVPGSAEAYVDPGTGGMLMQVVVGGLIAGVVTLRSVWHRLQERLSRRKMPPRD